jgi:hypothetical protein
MIIRNYEVGFLFYGHSSTHKLYVIDKANNTSPSKAKDPENFIVWAPGASGSSIIQYPSVVPKY